MIMASNLQTGSEPSLTSTVSGIIGDLQELIKQQMDLFKTEVAEDIRKTKEASASLALGALFLFLGITLLSVALVHVLITFVPLPPWASYLLVGAVITAIGGGLTYLGWNQFRSVTANQSVKSIKENLEWKTKPH
jgi:uncharacterized membrane protein YqjE